MDDDTIYFYMECLQNFEIYKEYSPVIFEALAKSPKETFGYLLDECVEIQKSARDGIEKIVSLIFVRDSLLKANDLFEKMLNKTTLLEDLGKVLHSVKGLSDWKKLGNILDTHEDSVLYIKTILMLFVELLPKNNSKFCLLYINLEKKGVPFVLVENDTQLHKPYTSSEQTDVFVSDSRREERINQSKSNWVSNDTYTRTDFDKSGIRLSKQDVIYKCVNRIIKALKSTNKYKLEKIKRINKNFDKVKRVVHDFEPNENEKFVDKINKMIKVTEKHLANISRNHKMYGKNKKELLRYFEINGFDNTDEQIAENLNLPDQPLQDSIIVKNFPLRKKSLSIISEKNHSDCERDIYSKTSDMKTFKNTENYFISEQKEKGIQNELNPVKEADFLKEKKGRSIGFIIEEDDMSKINTTKEMIKETENMLKEKEEKIKETEERITESEVEEKESKYFEIPKEQVEKAKEDVWESKITQTNKKDNDIEPLDNTTEQPKFSLDFISKQERTGFTELFTNPNPYKSEFKDMGSRIRSRFKDKSRSNVRFTYKENNPNNLILTRLKNENDKLINQINDLQAKHEDTLNRLKEDKNNFNNLLKKNKEDENDSNGKEIDLLRESIVKREDEINSLQIEMKGLKTNLRLAQNEIGEFKKMNKQLKEQMEVEKAEKEAALDRTLSKHPIKAETKENNPNNLISMKDIQKMPKLKMSKLLPNPDKNTVSIFNFMQQRQILPKETVIKPPQKEEQRTNKMNLEIPLSRTKYLNFMKGESLKVIENDIIRLTCKPATPFNKEEKFHFRYEFLLKNHSANEIRNVNLEFIDKDPMYQIMINKRQIKGVIKPNEVKKFGVVIFCSNIPVNDIIFKFVFTVLQRKQLMFFSDNFHLPLFINRMIKFIDPGMIKNTSNDIWKQKELGFKCCFDNLMPIPDVLSIFNGIRLIDEQSHLAVFEGIFLNRLNRFNLYSINITMNKIDYTTSVTVGANLKHNKEITEIELDSMLNCFRLILN